jgi:hypothetical protein
MNDSEVIPLLMSQVNWDLFNTTAGSHGFKVFKRLDEAKVKVDSPASVPTVLGNGHTYFGFYICLHEDDDVLKLCAFRKLTISAQSEGRRVYVTATGDLDGWREAVIEFCQDNYATGLRRVFNEIFMFFRRADLKSQWEGFSRVELPDETFILKG